MSKPSPIEKIKEWFSKHGLEWNEGIESTLMEDGVKCVEDLKYLKKKEWDDLFASEVKSSVAVPHMFMAIILKATLIQSSALRS